MNLTTKLAHSGDRKGSAGRKKYSHWMQTFSLDPRVGGDVIFCLYLGAAP